MRRKALKPVIDVHPKEQRAVPRKIVLLSGILVDIDGRNTSDCIIRDINARGAAISVCKSPPTGAQTFYLTQVTGSRTSRASRGAPVLGLVLSL